MLTLILFLVQLTNNLSTIPLPQSYRVVKIQSEDIVYPAISDEHDNTIIVRNGE